MASVTFTTQSAMQPTYRGATTQTKVQSMVTSATFSASDVYILNNIKIPHRAVITAVSYRGSVADGQYIIEMGLSGSNGVLDVFGSKTFSATAVIALTAVTPNVLPMTVSVSDDAADRYQTLAVRVDGAATSGTTSVSLQFMVTYYCP
jgi:hypothetical protein